MRGKDFNAGLRGVLFEAQHYERMGAALWLYGWLVLRQTHQQGEVGWVLGGSPISYREIEQETGFNCRTLERWMHTLRRSGYVETEAVAAGMIVRITKAKKFPQAGRNSAGPIRRLEGRPTQPRVVDASDPPWNHQYGAGIRSSSLEGSEKRSTPTDSHRDFHYETGGDERRAHANPSCVEPNEAKRGGAERDFTASSHYQQQQQFFAEARQRLQLLRAEREEAVRRELAVGTGPEVQRP